MPVTVTVNLPEPKSSDELSKKLDRQYDRLVKLQPPTKAPTVDFSKLLASQKQLLEAINRLGQTLAKGLDVDPLAKSMDRNWASLRKDMKAFQQPKVTVTFPQAFYRHLDALEEAVTTPPSMRMPPAMSQKLDAIKEAIVASRAKVRGMLR